MINSMLDLSSVAAYLARIGAEPRSLRVAVVKEVQGSYWRDVATIRINKDGTVDAPKDYAPTDSEAAVIRTEVTGASWPTHEKLGKSYELPTELKGVSAEDMFELKDTAGNLIMIQQRIEAKEGKRYVPWTFWSDKVWRKAEPDGLLPLFGLENIGPYTTVFIHEGAKAARAVTRLVNPKTEEERETLAAHPWGEELQGAAHLGWIGGALNPGRTDWSELKRLGVTRAYIVADNDIPGKEAVPKIAKKLRGMMVFSVEFNSAWPINFDLADPFPEHMFTATYGKKYYRGPAFRDMTHPATWATDMVPPPGGKGKPIAKLRPEFADTWMWSQESDLYLCYEKPDIRLAQDQFNKRTMPFSDVTNTAQLLNKAYRGTVIRLCYRPDKNQRIIPEGGNEGVAAFNLYSPSTVRPKKGWVGPWEDFLEYLFPIARERKEVERWCATLIAQPEIRMLYGLLLVTERQGVGKTTLGERILAPLVGRHNTGFPGERDIVESNFNGWAANKRLVVVEEIYTGHSFKAYNILKSYLTDRNINVNEKFQRPYVIENWLHFVACSNSLKALRMEETDRRWFYPKMAEVPWTRDKWMDFYKWLSVGGLQIIAQWAHEYSDYVQPGSHAPSTVSKEELIRDSKGDVLIKWIDVMESVEQRNEALTFALSEVIDYMRQRYGRVYDSPHQFKKEARARGWAVLEKRISYQGSMTECIISPAMYLKLAAEAVNFEEQVEQARKLMKKMQDWVDEHM